MLAELSTRVVGRRADVAAFQDHRKRILVPFRREQHRVRASKDFGGNVLHIVWSTDTPAVHQRQCSAWCGLKKDEHPVQQGMYRTYLQAES